MTQFIYNAVIKSVYDGDTATVDIDLGFHTWLRDEKLRFYGVNTPEVRGAEREQGLVVRDMVREWLPVGATIRLETLKDKSGKYGRTLGIITPEGWVESVNAVLLRDGHAKLEAYSASGERKVYQKLGFDR